MSKSRDEYFQIHLQREPNACFTNNYFTERLFTWKANIDNQPAFNHYKAVKYMCDYFPKTEEWISESMKEA